MHIQRSSNFQTGPPCPLKQSKKKRTMADSPRERGSTALGWRTPRGDGAFARLNSKEPRRSCSCGSPSVLTRCLARRSSANYISCLPQHSLSFETKGGIAGTCLDLATPCSREDVPSLSSQSPTRATRKFLRSVISQSKRRSMSRDVIHVRS